MTATNHWSWCISSTIAVPHRALGVRAVHVHPHDRIDVRRHVEDQRGERQRRGDVQAGASSAARRGTSRSGCTPRRCPGRAAPPSAPGRRCRRKRSIRSAIRIVVQTACPAAGRSCTFRPCAMSCTTGPRSRAAASSCGSRSRTRARATGTSAANPTALPQAPRSLRPAVPQGRQARHPADRQHPALPRPAPGPRAEERGGAPAPARPAAHHRRLARRSARHAPPDRRQPLLRGPEARGEAPRRDLPAERLPKFMRYFERAVDDEVLLRAPFAVPDDRGPALRLSRDAMNRRRTKHPRLHETSRPGRGTPAARRLPASPRRIPSTSKASSATTRSSTSNEGRQLLSRGALLGRAAGRGAAAALARRRPRRGGAAARRASSGASGCGSASTSSRCSTASSRAPPSKPTKPTRR